MEEGAGTGCEESAQRWQFSFWLDDDDNGDDDDYEDDDGGDDGDDGDDGYDGICRWQLSLTGCSYATSPQAGAT